MAGVLRGWDLSLTDSMLTTMEAEKQRRAEEEQKHEEALTDGCEPDTNTAVQLPRLTPLQHSSSPVHSFLPLKVSMYTVTWRQRPLCRSYCCVTVVKHSTERAWQSLMAPSVLCVFP